MASGLDPDTQYRDLVETLEETNDEYGLDLVTPHRDSVIVTDRNRGEKEGGGAYIPQTHRIYLIGSPDPADTGVHETIHFNQYQHALGSTSEALEESFHQLSNTVTALKEQYPDMGARLFKTTAPVTGTEVLLAADIHVYPENLRDIYDEVMDEIQCSDDTSSDNFQNMFKEKIEDRLTSSTQSWLAKNIPFLRESSVPTEQRSELLQPIKERQLQAFAVESPEVEVAAQFHTLFHRVSEVKGISPVTEKTLYDELYERQVSTPWRDRRTSIAEEMAFYNTESDDTAGAHVVDGIEHCIQDYANLKHQQPHLTDKEAAGSIINNRLSQYKNFPT